LVEPHRLSLRTAEQIQLLYNSNSIQIYIQMARLGFASYGYLS